MEKIFKIQYTQTLTPYYFRIPYERSIIADTSEEAEEILKNIEGDASWWGGDLYIDITKITQDEDLIKYDKYL